MRLIQISVTSVWLLRAVEMDFARGKIRNRWLMMGILLGVVLWIPGMKEAGFPELLGGLLLPVLICWFPFRMRGLGAGDIKYLNVSNMHGYGDDIVDVDDWTWIGNPTVPEIVYGFGPSFKYKNWDFSFFFQGVAKTSLFMSGFHPFGDYSLR